jgi:alkylglycerol monooxygenase
MGDAMNLIVLAIPLFFISMAAESAIAAHRRRPLYRGADVVASLALGTLQTLVGVVAAGVLVAMYATAYKYRLWTLPTGNPAVFVAAFIAVDFIYYWFHRCGHRVMLAWAVHAPHHSSDDYNLAVALRQGPLQPLLSRLFYLPLALLGLDLDSFALLASLNTIGQFWIHTQLVRRLGPLEWVLNTPSHHRVHHGCNSRYLDKNHAGIFIVWDRLFGTFVEEDDAEPPVFGTVTPAQTWNPLRLAWIPLGELWGKLRAAQGISDVAFAFFGPPEWRPATMAKAGAVGSPRAPFRSVVGWPRAAYAGVQFALVLGLSVWFLREATQFPVTVSAGIALWLAWSLGSVGAVLDRSRLAFASEVARHVMVVVVALTASG